MDERAFQLHYGATWLNFVATLTGRWRPRSVERLTSPRRLAEWLALVGLGVRGSVEDGDLAAAVELREALHALSRAVVEGKRPDARAVRIVNAAIEHDSAPALRVVKGELTASAPPNARAALGRVARQALEQLTGPERTRLRACGDDTCAGVYLDDTGRRRWCADATCGVRNRVRAHRARARP
jgi:predicted RNA-binding Zn ribbon-like protein